MVDVLLYVLLGFVQIAATTWGGIMSIKSLPPTEKKLPHLRGFILLGVSGVAGGPELA
jgi:hypothetical protein